MKKILSMTFFILLVSSIGVVFADTDKKNWVEEEVEELEYNVKKMYNDLFRDAATKATEARIQIATAADSLATAVEADQSAIEREKYIKALSADIVAVTHNSKIFYLNMAQKAGDMTDKFTKLLYGQEKNEDMLQISAKMFSKECDRLIYKLLDNADVSTADKQRIKAEYRTGIKAADIKLKNAYRTYAGFYLSGVTTGALYEKAKANFSNAVTSMITLTSNIYAKELAKLSPKEKARVVAERKAMVKQQSATLQKWIQEKKQDTKKK